VTEIFEMGLVKPRPNLTFGHMEVRIDTEASEVSDQVTYLYKLVYFIGYSSDHADRTKLP
jgi:hypothetical protein